MKSEWTDPALFQGSLLTDPGDRRQVQAVVRDYRLMVLCVLDAILKRYERDPAYHFLDTKLSLITGLDFDDADPIRGRGTIYGWIQGRGLEALAGHDEWIGRQDWLDADARADFHERLTRAMSEVVEQMEALRARNGGRLFFMMTRDGRPLKMDGGKVAHADLPPGLPRRRPGEPGSPTNVSDMFYCKGLAAAAWRLGDAPRLRAAGDLFAEVCRDIAAERFYSDQQQFDPRNPVSGVPGRNSHGSRMLSIGAAARFLECTGDVSYLTLGLDCIDYILSRHVEQKGNGPILPFDMWEFTDDAGKPFHEGRVLRSDTGHATEFVGLALKLIRVAQTLGVADADVHRGRIDMFRDVLPKVLLRNFANGFSPSGCGIVKAFDLISRKALNDQMPWWNLPETMRAAMEAARRAGQGNDMPYAEIAARCSNAFVKHFVRKDLHLMAYQTIAPDGKVVEVIPATPDADPAYHTGLSILDCLDVIG